MSITLYLIAEPAVMLFMDELNPEIREEGLDTNVIVKKLPAEVGAGSKFFSLK